ncbi:MAG: GDSL-type esterase/lipase family protein [Promethearchaeota archaeon]
MNIYQDTLIMVVLFCAMIVGFFLVRFALKLVKGDPTFWERSIRSLEKQDLETPPPSGSILFTGSSSIRYWKTLEEDMAPLSVLNRGFGGSRISDVTYYADRIVFPYKPGGIVFYAGENDISGLVFTKKKTPEEVANDFRSFCSKIHTKMAEVPVYFISIKPPKRRRKLWPEMQEANRLVEEICQSDSRLNYIDIVESTLDPEGNPRHDIFKWDGIHLNEKGYEIWTSIVKPVLLESFDTD